MKKFLLILLIFAIAVAAFACGRKKADIDADITSPSDIYCPPEDNEEAPSPSGGDSASVTSPSDIIPKDDVEITEQAFFYKAYYKPEAHRFEDMKGWISSIDGLPGFTAQGTFDPKLCNYVITGGMGGCEAIDYIEVCDRNITVYFHPDIPLGPTMESCPGGAMINSYKAEVTGGDGNKYTSTLHKYYVNGGELYTTTGTKADYIIFTFDDIITEPITDFYVYWGAVD